MSTLSKHFEWYLYHGAMLIMHIFNHKCSCSWCHVHESSCVLMNAPMSTHEYSRGPMSIHEHSITWGHGLMSSQERYVTVAPYSRVILSAHKCSWALMNAQALYSTIIIKCWLLKWLSFSNLPISRLIFHQIIKKWIFLISAQEGLFRNVQDGISRPL